VLRVFRGELSAWLLYNSKSGGFQLLDQLGSLAGINTYLIVQIIEVGITPGA